MTFWVRFCHLLLLLAADCEQVRGTGTLFIQFIRYENPGGKGNNGHCCDGRSITCETGGGCDHYFIVCADRDHGSASMDDCDYGDVETNSISDEATIDFSQHRGIGSNTPNPITFNFNTWSGSTDLKVRIKDSDGWNSDDLVDDVRGIVSTTPYVYNKPATLRARTRLDVKVWVRCDSDWYGAGCDVYCKPRNDNGGHYRCTRGTGVKSCHAGWTGANCDININECARSPCQNMGTCVDGINSYTCRCPTGVRGRHCETNIDECISSPCQHGGTCRDLINRYLCQCRPGWEGRHCEADINECLRGQCHNGGTCQNTPGSFFCTCGDGYAGSTCEIVTDHCLSTPCENGGRCVTTSSSFTCVCHGGFTGSRCHQEIDECLSCPCHNGATCVDRRNGYECRCTPGYQGDQCQTNIDECLSNPCQNGARCLDDTAGYRCTCSPGFTGATCEVEIDHCESGPCQNEGSCTNSRIGFACQCHEGWEGLTCSGNINECETEPCENGGICRDMEGSYECTCEAGYSGRHCEVDIDECVSDPCQNGGYCQDDVDGFVCICPKDTGGSLCEDQLQDKTPAARDPPKPTQNTAKMGESSKYLSETEARTYVFDRLLYMNEEGLVRRIVESQVKVLSHGNPRMELRILPFFGTCNDPKSHRHSAMRLSIVIKPNDNMTTSVLNAGLEAVMESVTARITSVRDVTNNADNTCTVSVVSSEPVPKTNAFLRYWVLITAITLTVVVVAAIVVFTLCRLRRKNTKQRKDRERSGPAFEQGFVGCEPSSQIGNTGMLIDSLSYYDKIKIEEDMLRRDSIDSFKIPLTQLADSHL